MSPLLIKTIVSIQRRRFTAESWYNFYKGVQTTFSCIVTDCNFAQFRRDWRRLKRYPLELSLVVTFIRHHVENV